MRAVLRFAVDTARIWLVARGALAVEQIVVAAIFRVYFAGAWEIAAIRSHAVPIGAALLVPFALLAALLGRLGAATVEHRTARIASASLLALVGTALGVGVTFGRHFASLEVRVPFVLAFSVAGALAGAWLVPRVSLTARRFSGLVALSGMLLAPLFWCADLFVLPRLYPAFHLALFVLLFVSVAMVSLAWRNYDRVAVAVAAAVALIALGGAWRTRCAPEELLRFDNVRVVLVERAPMLGRVVMAVSWVHPEPPEEAVSTSSPVEVARALDWTGRDIVLLSVDALRADHVSAYGYERETTPHLNQLAKEGALFSYAYASTPHTSYSITSLMTGKHMRPLMRLGLGDDAETWAAQLRRYGVRTAAFYPPAVFFIDEGKFVAVRDRRLDFEYAKVEFGSPELRVGQVDAYLETAPMDRPLFLWVHFFEPHEPYVGHPEHDFGRADIDRYDSEIAAVDDGIGQIVEHIRLRRPGAVFVVTADHGEEFGEHGGRYHGTTVYEEQVRVPLVIAGDGVVPGKVAAVVQTIDLLPTVLSAFGIPRPPRVRGRDLGPLLAGKDRDASGFAFAETDDYALAASGTERLVCIRKVSACALYDVASDPLEVRDRSGDKRDSFHALKQRLRGEEREHGRYEASSESKAWPEPLRRGLQGDAEASEDIASLLDDADVVLRRKAAEVLFSLHPPGVVAALRRSLERDEDDEVRRWDSLALVRLGEAASAMSNALLHDPQVAWRRRAALVFAERGDGRGESDLVAWWGSGGLPLDEAREVLLALGKIRARSAVPSLVRSFSDVRLRAELADTLGAIGDRSARGALLAVFAEERYVHARASEARALLALGAREELRGPLARFAGVAEPLGEAVGFAREAGLLVARSGGVVCGPSETKVAATVTVPEVSVPLRLLVLTRGVGGATRGVIAGRALGVPRGLGRVSVFEVGALQEATVRLAVEDDVGLEALWLVARAEEVPPPKPVRWDDGGTNEPR